MNAVFSSVRRVLDYLGPKLILVVAVLLALALLVGIYLGRQSVYDSLQVDPQTASDMLLELPDLRKAVKTARDDLDVQRTRHEVDRRALELVRSEMAAEKERIAELEEGLSFYRSLMVSGDVRGGLSLRKPELVSTGTPGHLKYRFFVQQNEREYKMVEGSLAVELYGIRQGKLVRYPLQELSPEFDTKASTLHFRYFQAIEGELVLPPGFEPQGISLVARASKPRQAKVKEQFPWELQERFINVGK